MAIASPAPKDDTSVPAVSTAMLERAEQYSYWAKRHAIALKASRFDLTLVAICSVIAIANFISILFGANSANSVFISLVSPVSMIIGYALRKSEEYTEAKKKAFLDPHMNMRDYDLLLASIRSAGIATPELYVIEHPENVTAYRSVLKAACYKIEAPVSGRKKRKVAIDILEEHRVASLVLPGPEEARRSERIITLIEDRKVNRYEDIKALVEQHDFRPLSLQDGTL